MRFIEWCKRHAVLLTIITVSLVALPIIIFTVIVPAQKNSSLEIMVAPSTAVVSIDNKIYQNGTYDFFPGEVSVSISADGYQTKEFYLNLEPHKRTDLHEYLVPNDGNMEKYYDTNDINLLRNLGKAELDPLIKKYDEYVSLDRELPYTYEKYSNDYSEHTWFIIEKTPYKDCGYFCLTIDDKTGGNYDLAINELIKLGFNVDKCEIVYKYSTSNNPTITGFSHDGR